MPVLKNSAKNEGKQHDRDHWGQGELRWPVHHAGNERNRCTGCLDAISIMIPALPQEAWHLKLVNDEVMTALVRYVVALPHKELHERAAPLLARQERAYQDFARLARTVGDGALTRDLVARIVEVPHLVIDSTIINFWVRYYHESTQTM